MSDKKEKLEATAKKLGIGGYQRHVLLCVGDDCCSSKTGQEAWSELKKQIKENGLTEGGKACYRSKVGCLRVCTSGPTMLVYPEGTWYHGMTAERMPRFVKEHLIEGQPVEEWIFARNPIGENE